MTATTSGRPLTRAQAVILGAAAVAMLAIGAAGAVGTFSNLRATFPGRTALGAVAAGEGATLILALVYVGLTMLGQSAPAAVRIGLWALPAVASAVGAVAAHSPTATVVYAVTPLAMCTAAEGAGLLARRIVVRTTGVDMEARRRAAAAVRRLAYEQARAERHPDQAVRDRAQRRAWRLAARVGEGDTALGEQLVDVQRVRLTEGADAALGAMFAPGVTPVPQTVTQASEPTPLPPAASAERALTAALDRVRQPKPRKQPPPSTPAGPVGDPVDDTAALFGHAHAPVVYYLRNGDRVKIGMSQNIKRRVAALSLRPADVVRIEHGDQEHERAQHLRFADLRAGNTEWFELRDDLAAYLGLSEPEHAVTPVTDDGTQVSTPAGDEPEEPETPVVTLDELAAIAGVDVPTTGEPLTDEQLLVVLRWLRYQDDPPLSYRQARVVFRALGFTAAEDRVRPAWRRLENDALTTD